MNIQREGGNNLKTQIGKTTIDFDELMKVKNHLVQGGKVGKGSTMSDVVRAAFKLIIEELVEKGR